MNAQYYCLEKKHEELTTFWKLRLTAAETHLHLTYKIDCQLIVMFQETASSSFHSSLVSLLY
jgi:hypothetical protein